MKRTKRILAVIGIVFLAGLYLATLIFALIGSDWAYNLFKLCLGFTVIVPVLLYAYTLMYRLLSGSGSSAPDTKEPVSGRDDSSSGERGTPTAETGDHL